MPEHPNTLLLVFLWCPLVGGTRLIGMIVGTVILVGSRHQDDAQHCLVPVFIHGTMSRVSTLVGQAQLTACVLLNECCLAHVPGDTKVFPVSLLLLHQMTDDMAVFIYGENASWQALVSILVGHLVVNKICISIFI